MNLFLNGKPPFPQMMKSNLPTKLCPVCSRDFTWTKKWRVEWNNVIYCSEKCRRDKSIEWSIGYSKKESKKVSRKEET